MGRVAMRATTVGAVVAACVLVVIVAVAWRQLSSDEATPATKAAPAEGSEPIRARPAPEQAPDPVEAPGECGRAMAAIRGVQAKYPSGAMLPAQVNADLTADLVRLDDACAAHAELEQEFRERELTPWLTYLPPGAGQ